MIQYLKLILKVEPIDIFEIIKYYSDLIIDNIHL